MAYNLRSRDAAAPGVSGDETPAVTSIAIVEPPAAEVLRVSSAAAEMGITPEMSVWPLLGSLSESHSVDEPAGPSQSVFATCLGLVPTFALGETTAVSGAPLDPGAMLSSAPAAGMPTPAADLTLSHIRCGLIMSTRYISSCPPPNVTLAMTCDHDILIVHSHRKLIVL